MNRIVALALVFCLGSRLALSEERELTGRVVDSQGKPVANVSVATLWRANGSSKRPDGKAFDLSNKDQLHEFWGRLGQMESDAATRTKDDGSFAISPNWRARSLYAIDADRQRGCIVDLPESTPSQPIVVMELKRLVTVTAEFRTSVKGTTAQWCHAYVELPWDAENPLASNRLISCGSFEGRFEVKLPPGTYQLDAYGTSDAAADVIDLRVYPPPRFTVPSSETKLDLGVLELTLAPPSRDVLEGASKQAGRWKDYTKHYGEPAPDWYSVDGRGIDHQAKLKSLSGKWVVLYFWGMSCAPCLAKGIPKMTDFYERNSGSRDQFEVVGVCIDHTGEIDNMSKLDQALSPVETNVWKGRRIPFPIVIDNTFQTWERYGIPGLGTVVLVDPEGRIVEGDESKLQEILDQTSH